MNKKLATGCGVLLVLLAIIIGIGIYAVPKLVRKAKVAIKSNIEESNRLAAIESKWRPPSAAPDASWFPKQVENWQLTTQETSTGIPALNIERAGQYGAYRSGAEVVEVNVVTANDLEKDALFSKAQAALSTGTRVSSSSGNRVYVRLNGNDYTRMWWIKNWLFIFRSHGGSDPETFMEAYMKAMNAAETP